MKLSSITLQFTTILSCVLFPTMKPCERQEFSQTLLFYFFQFSLRIILIFLKVLCNFRFLNSVTIKMRTMVACMHVSAYAMTFLLEMEENIGGWKRKAALELEYKGYDGAIRTTLLRPSK